MATKKNCLKCKRQFKSGANKPNNYICDKCKKH